MPGPCACLATPRELWLLAGEDPERYRELMAQHGYEPEPDAAPWPRLTETEYAAMIPARMDAIVGEMNERLADILPDGTRLDWR